ncbi:hypothetical protein [Pseudoalteromonas sp. Of7M-16]|uniref:hypothetical protein n=1 Tax=Pseudoalteromonas sp. Of7M-16 TaxID=2917756 RepID=UPI001EF4883B|nr:hypothetical protein [Pseudoalteromonas sp. Of7M-16]MCG7548581.1 hypothetical protein [Pseudoalteromonas sp. Of7M-16]
MNQIPAIHAVMREIEDKLTAIPGTYVRTGFVQQHIKNLIKDKQLPALVLQPGNDAPAQAINDATKISREINVAALVDTRDKDTVISRLDDLLYQMRSAIYVGHEETAKASVALGPAKFDYPDPGEQVALVETVFTLNYQEKWREE